MPIRSLSVMAADAEHTRELLAKRKPAPTFADVYAERAGPLH